MIRAALTGGIATGKSHVLAAFARLGVPTIDADVLAHRVIAPGTPGADAVVTRFGHQLTLPDGSIDRRALGAVVFGNANARRDLEAIVHPEVYRAIETWLAGLPPGTPLAVADIPLLFETNHHRDFDLIVVAACSPEEQLRRVRARDQLSEEDARARISAQLPIEYKADRANHVVWTMGSHEQTTDQVREIIRHEVGAK